MVCRTKFGHPIRNVEEFDIGKLVVPGVFFDSDPLTNMAKKYDPITKAVKNHVGDILFRVFPELIKEVFKLNPNQAIYEKIEME